MKLNIKLSKSMTIEERKAWRYLAKAIDPTFSNTIPKQEALLDFIRARNELDIIRPGMMAAMKYASDNPTIDDAILNLSKWQTMVSKTEIKIERLRKSIGLTSEYESKLRAARKVKDGGKGGGHAIKPWDTILNQASNSAEN